MAQFRQKPVVIEAMFYDGSADSFNSLWNWACPSNDSLQSPVHFTGSDDEPGHIIVQTLDREVMTPPEVWIVKGVAGEFYPCKPAIFEKTYEPVKEG